MFIWMFSLLDEHINLLPKVRPLDRVDSWWWRFDKKGVFSIKSAYGFGKRIRVQRGP